MILDKEDYAAQRPAIKNWIHNNPEKLSLDMIPEMSVYTGCPIIVVCYFVGELEGFSSELLSKIERLKTFYGVDDVK